MSAADLEGVLAIERVSFPRPWSARAFLSELSVAHAYYVVARDVAGSPHQGTVPKKGRRLRWWVLSGGDPGKSGPRQPVVGYAGFHVVFEEGHITTLAVYPTHRHRGLGAWLLMHLFEEAERRGVQRMTLEVRPSNSAALALYETFGFQVEGRRPRYYSDGEDALIMWTGPLDTPESQARLQELRARLQEKLTAAGNAWEETSDSDSSS